MLAATVIAGILNYLSNTLLGRMLGPSDYSVFTSLVSLSLILGVFAEIAQTVITNYAARLSAKGGIAEIGTQIIFFLKRLALFGMLGAVVLWLLSKPLAEFLQIPSVLPVLALGCLAVPMAVLPAISGGLRGLQRFGSLGWVQISSAAFRLAVGVSLVALGLGTVGAAWSLPVSALGASALGLLLLGDVLRKRDPGKAPSTSGLSGYSSNTALALICFSIMINSDIVIVKSCFSPTEAGLYSAAATLGKTAFWLSGAVAMLLLPKVAKRHSLGLPAVGLLRKSLLIVGLLGASMAAAFFLFPSFLIGVLFGKEFLANTSLLGPYAIAMTLLALVKVWLLYYLAVQESAYAYLVLLGSASLVIALILVCSSLYQVVVTLIAVGLAMCLGAEVLHLVRGSRRA
jgi:O-antigen/teichoic acid export membrane protein